MTMPEFPRPVRLDALGEAPRTVAIEAAPDERAALARRFALVALDRLAARAAIRREGAELFAEGRIVADVVQACVVTDAPVAAHVEAPFMLRFVPEEDAAPADEIELSAAECDTLGYSGGAIDLGEAVAQTLLLALDPFPRAADADPGPSRSRPARSPR